MENLPSDIRPLSTPSSYRQSNPAVLPPPPLSEKARRLRRKRLIFGFSIAAALHVGLILAWWLTPPLRLKASYSPERWVQVLPLIKPDPPVTPDTEKPAGHVADPAPPAEPVKKHTRRSHKATAVFKPQP
jgi:hypothetical protein